MNYALIKVDGNCEFDLETRVNSAVTRPAEFALNQCYFTQGSHVANVLSDNVFSMISRTDEGKIVPLLFAQQGSRIVCRNRTSALSQRQISEIADRLFDNSNASHVVFEDIDLDQSVAERTRLQLAFSYQENWLCDINPDTSFMSGRKLSNLRRKGRRLQEHIGRLPVEFRFERCSDEDIDTVVKMNRETLTAKNKKHRFDADQIAKFKDICRQSGYLAGLFVGKRLIAGDIINIVNGQAFFNVVGYDAEFERFSPGAQVHYYALRECKNRGCKAANFLWGNSRWKSDFGARRIPLTTLVVSRNVSSMVDIQYFGSIWPHAKTTAFRKLKSALKP